MTSLLITSTLNKLSASSQDMPASRVDSDRRFAVECISPPPACISDTALNIAFRLAFGVAALALALALTHIACGTELSSDVSCTVVLLLVMMKLKR